MEKTYSLGYLANSLKERANQINFELDLGDVGNEVGIRVGNMVKNMTQEQIQEFINGFRHGVSLTNGTH